MIVIYVLVYLYVFWLLYLVFTSLYRAHLAGRLVGISKLLGYPIIIVAVIVDWFANIFIATVLFQERPGSWKQLVTQRLTSYMAGADGRNKRWATWLCQNLLDPFDSRGSHCQ